ncbi:MAG: hypothetical protein PUB03_04995 [bacterium]|nr:hypothetical protein [bacterium]
MKNKKIKEREEYLKKYGIGSIDTGYSCYEEKKNLSVEEQELRWVKYILSLESTFEFGIDDSTRFALSATLLSTTLIFSNSDVLDSVVKILTFLYFTTMLYNYFEGKVAYSKYKNYLKSKFDIKTFQKRQIYDELPMTEVIFDTSDLSLYDMDEVFVNEQNIMQTELVTQTKPKVLTKRKVKTDE